MLETNTTTLLQKNIIGNRAKKKASWNLERLELNLRLMIELDGAKHLTFIRSCFYQSMFWTKIHKQIEKMCILSTGLPICFFALRSKIRIKFELAVFGSVSCHGFNKDVLNVEDYAVKEDDYLFKESHFTKWFCCTEYSTLPLLCPVAALRSGALALRCNTKIFGPILWIVIRQTGTNLLVAWKKEEHIAPWYEDWRLGI